VIPTPCNSALSSAAGSGDNFSTMFFWSLSTTAQSSTFDWSGNAVFINRKVIPEIISTTDLLRMYYL
jgi:hypothetical protein